MFSRSIIVFLGTLIFRTQLVIDLRNSDFSPCAYFMFFLIQVSIYFSPHALCLVQTRAYFTYLHVHISTYLYIYILDCFNVIYFNGA